VHRDQLVRVMIAQLPFTHLLKICALGFLVGVEYATIPPKRWLHARNIFSKQRKLQLQSKYGRTGEPKLIFPANGLYQLGRR
jgi:hypothetical protein